MTWDEATTVTNDRAEAALNPERRTSLQVAAESDYDPTGTPWRTCDQGGCWHWLEDLPCPPDAWPVARQVAS